MNRVPKGPSFISGVFGLLGKKPAKGKVQPAKKTVSRTATVKNKQAYAPESSPYRAAEIIYADCACDAVRSVAGRRFLLREVPRIPVADCTMRKCECSYVRFKDRRNENSDRRALFSVKTHSYATHGNSERRQRAGRRDREASTPYSDSSALIEFEKWDM